MPKLGEFKVLLIGGTSHVGKTTFARSLANELNCGYLSTDTLARHPGRPWRKDNSPLPDDVIEHYSTLKVEELVSAVMGHYRENVWPIVDALVRSSLNNSFDPGLIVEGSSILPNEVLAADFDQVGAIWLTAPVPLIESRIMLGSQFEKRSQSERQLISAFLRKSLTINEEIMDTVSTNDQQSLDVSTLDSTTSLLARLQVLHSSN